MLETSIPAEIHRNNHSSISHMKLNILIYHTLNECLKLYLFSFVETPFKYIVAELSIRKLGFSSVLIIPLFEFTRPFL